MKKILLIATLMIALVSCADEKEGVEHHSFAYPAVAPCSCDCITVEDLIKADAMLAKFKREALEEGRSYQQLPTVYYLTDTTLVEKYQDSL